MNILLNTYCNLQCPYCFADPTMKECEVKNISLGDFNYVLNFQKRNNMGEVRLIGGEPTLHPQFKEIINRIINSRCFRRILIFSNFTFSEDIAEFLVSKSKEIEIDFLPNINEFHLIGNKMSERIKANLDLMFEKCEKLRCLGINIYNPKMSLKQWEQLIEKYKDKIKYVRYSIAIPTKAIIENKFDFYSYYNSFEDVMWELLKICEKHNIFMHCDCNNVPPCCFSAELIAACYKSNPDSLGSDMYCSYPVIDVKPDLSVAGCFGFFKKEQEGKSFKDFKTLEELNDWALKTGNTDNLVARKECLECVRYKRVKKSCSCKSTHLIDITKI